MNDSDIDLEFFGLDLGKGPKSLGELCRIEITLNYPRTAKFKRMDSDQQRALYEKWLLHFVKEYDHVIIKMDKFYEKCQSGDLHLHLYMEVKMPDDYFIFGCVRTIAIPFLSFLPLRYNKFDNGKYNCAFHRYRCPAIVVQWRSDEEELRILHWESYIRKSQ